ncbi:DUF3800 domain-containing protein [Clostridium sp.]|uniref:DUF3800 domain-containing protein n=1 Tax=Clostridium sp. TaxID=1506 RepID=UPI001A3F1216|nr:DUF3800 domain-containing protein [Clostridium sp.]MBK5240244.1 hypothetical protein [Clostridium sp.]
MKTILEIGELRDLGIEYSGLKGMNEVYTFYYDETNNVRKFCLKEDGYNSSVCTTFVLGGVMHRGLSSTANTEELWRNLKLQRNIKEIKLIHLAKGDFIKCLDSTKLNYYLKWLLDSDLYIHYSALNLLYFSLIDIVDSAIENSDVSKSLGREFSDLLKNNLYTLVKMKEALFVKLFYKYKYPDIQKEDIRAFINELINIIRQYEDIPNLHIGLVSLRQILKESLITEELVFIMNEKEKILIENFMHFYLRPVYMFKNSIHIFDNEDSIKLLIKETGLSYYDDPLKNYDFVNSQSSKYIQISDVFIGLFGKFTMFINSNTVEEIQKILSNLVGLQEDNLKLFRALISKSDTMNKALLFTSVSWEERSKYEMFY